MYGVLAFLNRLFKAPFAVKLSSKVISVGNFCVGGSGKTPIVCELIEILSQKGFVPVIISKSYKASLDKPAEVLASTLDPHTFGDEVVLIKNKFKEARVFSGPSKFKTAIFADKLLSNVKSKIFIVDDGAQHHKLHKDIKIHVWDMSRPFVDLFPFPLGRSREFWFFGEKPNLSVFNRSKDSRRESLLWNLVGGEKIRSKYQVLSILNFHSKELLRSDFTLISGLGNFEQLRKSVNEYIFKEPYEMAGAVEGRDHDDFRWFQAKKNINYVCTEKDVFKLKEKIEKAHLFVVSSDFSSEFKTQLSESLERFL